MIRYVAASTLGTVLGIGAIFLWMDRESIVARARPRGWPVPW